MPLYFLGVMILLLNDVHFGEYRIALNGDFVMNATYDDAHDGALTGDAMTLLCLRRGDLNGEQFFSCTISFCLYCARLNGSITVFPFLLCKLKYVFFFPIFEILKNINKTRGQSQ